jgi:PAS domain S-box-containing protein
LLVFASVLPLLGLGLVREYWAYQAERDAIRQGLMTIARGVAVSVQRDLLLRTSVLETLAMSPTLRSDDLTPFSQEAAAFLRREPASAMLGLVAPDATLIRAYGAPEAALTGKSVHTATASGHQVFDTGASLVTDLHVGHRTGLLAFSVDVPVLKDGQVAYDLFLRLRPEAMADLVTHLDLPPGRVVAIADSNGVVVARVPNGDQYVGHPIVPALWAQIQARSEGATDVPTLEGTPAIGAFAHVAPFNWAVTVGAPEAMMTAALHAAILHSLEDGGFVLAAALILATFAARRITDPITQLRRLAERGDLPDAAEPAGTGLAETDSVARVLLAAAAERRAAAAALAESEQRFRSLFERSPSGSILVDPDTTQVIDCNEAAASFVGYTVAAFRQVRLSDIAIGTSPDRMRAVIQSVLQGQVHRYETRVRGKQGERDLLVAVAPIRVAGRTLILVSQLDVTELRAAEVGLRVNEERLELARQGASLGIWDWDIANDVLVWSDHQWHLHELDAQPGGPTPHVWRAALDPQDRDRVSSEIALTVKQPGRVFATEYTVRLRDGGSRRLLARGQAIRDAKGRAGRLVGINMDVTARHEAELARDRLITLLKSEQSRLSEIIDILPVGVGIADRSGRFVLSNPAMRNAVGAVIPSLDGAAVARWIAHRSDGSPLPPADFPAARALRGDVVLPGQEFLFRSESGDQTWFRVSCVPLKWENGVVREVLAVLQNIDAERRLVALQQEANLRLEQRVKQEVTAREAAQQRAAQAERMQALGQIAGGIAHDFNNVLQAVAGGAALIEARFRDPDRVLRHARMIADAARRGASITSRLLAFARRGDLRAESVDAAPLLTDMAEVFSHTLGAGVVCKVDVPDGVPALLADRGQLETVLVNLATNARDAMPSGGELLLSAAAEVVDADGPPHPAGLSPGAYVRLTIGDTGTGMDAAVLAHVTEPFFTTKEPGKGTGLGLAMAKGFVEQSGGRMSIDSQPNQGTRISLWLPRADVPDGATVRLARSSALSPAAPCVLLVDDDPIVRAVLAASLEDCGYLVLTADGASPALALLDRQERIEILVTDLTMPAMDGVSLIKAAQALRPNLPAVLLTGNAGDGATLAFGGAISGTFTLLRKPVTGAELADRIGGLLESRRLQRSR